MHCLSIIVKFQVSFFPSELQLYISNFDMVHTDSTITAHVSLLQRLLIIKLCWFKTCFHPLRFYYVVHSLFLSLYLEVLFFFWSFTMWCILLQEISLHFTGWKLVATKEWAADCHNQDQLQHFIMFIWRTYSRYCSPCQSLKVCHLS